MLNPGAEPCVDTFSSRLSWCLLHSKSDLCINLKCVYVNLDYVYVNLDYVYVNLDYVYVNLDYVYVS